MEGEHTLNNAFKAAHHTHRMHTWSFRFTGWLLLFFAITSTSTFLHILCKKVMILLNRHFYVLLLLLFFLLVSSNQFLWSLAPNPSNSVSGNLLLSSSLTLIITAAAWMCNRPWMGGGMIIAAISPYLLCARGLIQYQRVSY